MIRNTKSYWCEYCPRNSEIPEMPIDEGMGFRSLRELGEHVEQEHPDQLPEDSVREFVESVLDDAETFIDETIDPAIEAAKQQKTDDCPLGIGWNDAVESEVTRFQNKREQLRNIIVDERNALNREYFHDLAPTYARHWDAESSRNDHSTSMGLLCATAMAHEATEELGYEVDEWMCFWYLQEEPIL